MLCQRGRNTRVVARLCALTAALCVLCALFVGSASAQEGAGLEPSEEQYRLNEKGMRAYKRKKYDKALEFYEEALALGELNTLYLNLARTYQRLGKCVEAELTFRKVLTAPAVIDPPADKVREAVKRFRADDKEVCYGRLKLRCDLEGMKVVLNDDEEVPCDGVERPAPPGPYKFVASGWGQERTFTAEVKPGEGSDVVLTLGISASEAKAWELVEEARGELSPGALEGAGAKLTEAVALNDGWWVPHALLGEVARRQGRLEDAKEHLTQALARSPDAQRGQLETALAGIEREIKARQPVDVVSDVPKEYPHLGVSLTFTYGISKITDASESLPQLSDSMAGGAFDVGYDLSPFTKWTWGGLWIRTHMGIYGSTIKGGMVEINGLDMDLNYLVYDILIGSELRLNLFFPFEPFIGVAGGVSAFRASTPDIQRSINGREKNDSVTAKGVGALSLNAGFHILLHPDWSLRFAGELKQNFGDAVLKSSEGVSVFENIDPVLGSLSSSSLQVGLSYIF